jgi:methionine sulfoxide reductase heme-binding subunit
MQRRHLYQAAAVALGVLPAVRLGVGLFTDDLGADPVEELLHGTGDWALRLLLASLAITPLRRLGLRVLAPLRRTLGLLSFFYASAHLVVYAALDQGLDLDFIWEDVREHPYVMAGLASFLCLLPLAITSTRGWIRSLGRRWIQLHRIVYVAAVAAVVHFIWLVKADVREPLVYAGALAALLAVRVGGSVRIRRAISRAPHADA